MPWFITDDGFPEHPKVDRLEAVCETWERFAAARTVWHDMGCDCARRLTDGAFLRVLRRLVQHQGKIFKASTEAGHNLIEIRIAHQKIPLEMGRWHSSPGA